ncbi:hypothetical protein [Kribbella solani]|uniref:Secreted protein n=1 Tax=Kribbella solani TaxID=236067 RepID=A0A841DQE5_9ACTN|nr:hypothetical protein [Kribbella solani]MBB5980079.1 hypothetical protein [Kribbella solani]
MNKHLRRRGPLARLFAILVGAVLLLQAPSLAVADGGPTGSDQSFAQSLGERELTVTVRRIDKVPGPLRIDVVTHRGSPPGKLMLALVPQDAKGNLSAPGQVTERGTVELGAEPGLYGVTLTVDRAGPWELEIGDGTRTARIPFVVQVKVVAPTERAAYGGFIAAGGCLVCALVAAVRRRGTGVAMVATGGLVMALSVGITGAMLSPTVRPPAVPGSETDATLANTVDPYADASAPRTDPARPPVNIRVEADAATAGRRFELRLVLTDGSTGRPVDDLQLHHGALAHLVVISPSGQLWHLHPIRVAAGDYRVELTPTEPGTYALSVELARRGGGMQLVRPAGFPVAGQPSATKPAAEPAPAGLGARVVDGTKVTVSAGRPAAGRSSTISVAVDAPLQLWLGMQGHLIAAGPVSETKSSPFERAPVWLHGHAMAPGQPTVNPPDETVAGFGPEVRFTTTFPYPGRYYLWVQVERDYAVLTIPVVLDVPATNGEVS